MSFNDVRGALANFYTRHWRNPHPDKTIRELTFSAPKDSNVPAALLAVSLGDASDAVPAPDDRAAAGRLKDWSEPAAYRTVDANSPGSVVLSDFSGGRLRRARRPRERLRQHIGVQEFTQIQQPRCSLHLTALAHRRRGRGCASARS